MNEQLIQALALIAARLEAGGQQLLLESLPASLRDLVAQASTSVVSAEGESVSILLQELQPPDRAAAVQDSDTVPADSDEAAAGSEATDPEATSSRPSTFAGTLLGLISMAAVPDRAARLLDELPRHLKGQLMQALVTVSSLSASRRDLGTEAAGIAAELCGQLGGGEAWGGVDKAVEIVRALGDDGRMGRALAALASVDDKALAQIQNSLFPFEDLMTLQDAELQVLMMQVDNATLGRALQETSEATKKRLYENMSARRRRIVVEEEEHHEDATPEEVEEAHGVVMDAVRELYRSQKIDTYFGSAQEESRPRPVDEARERAPEAAGAPAGSGPGDSGAVRPEKDRAKPAPAKKPKKSPLAAVLGGLGVVVLVVSAWLWFGGGTSTNSEKAKSTAGSAAGGSSNRSGSAGEIRVGSDTGKDAASSAGEVTRTPVRQTRMTAAGKVVLELPPETRSEVEPIGERAQVFHEQNADPEEPKGLFMSVGRVRTTILDQDFYVRTPIVKITGSQGAVFETRVVIDRTTYVEVEAGEVVAESTTRSGGPTHLTAGEKARFDP